MDNTNWSNIGNAGVGGASGSGDSGQGQNPPNNNDHRKIIVNDEGVQKAILRKASLVNYTMKYLDATKTAICNKSEQVRMRIFTTLVRFLLGFTPYLTTN
jgi:hypothetical protein